MIGIQQQELIAIFNIPAAVAGPGGTNPPTDLAPYMVAGGPLQFMLRPKRLDWKIQGQPDTSYMQSDAVDELDDVQLGNVGALQYRWAAGSIQITPSGTALTLRVYIWSLTPSNDDQADTLMRGIGELLAYEVATYVCDMNNGLGKLGPRLEKRASRLKQRFANLLVMQGQSQLMYPRSTKRGTASQISVGGTPAL